MALIEIRTADNLDRGVELFALIQARAENRKGLMRNFTGIMADEVEENFDREGRPRWKPLAASTIRSRKAKGNWPGKILQVRGRLASSFHGSHDNDSATYGTNVIYAAIQHFGGTTKHAARMRVMHFDQRVSGKMTHGRPGKNVDHFAKPGKAKYAIRTMGKAYEATIPARPMLTLSPAAINNMIKAAKEWVMNVKVR